MRWASFTVDRITLSSIERSRRRFRAHLPELIWNAAAGEGNAFTLPEVRTFLVGVIAGGRKLADELQIIALSQAYSRLDELFGHRQFSAPRPCPMNFMAWLPGTRRSNLATSEQEEQRLAAGWAH